MSVMVVGHRGVAGLCPENTRASILKAAELGLKWVEIDIQPTADGELVVCHDHRIDRCSSGEGRVDSYTLAELKTFDFGSWFGDAFAGETILTLVELLELAKAHQLALNIEVKLDTDVAEPVVTKLKEALRTSAIANEQILLSSFSTQVMHELAKHCCEYRLGVISEQLTEDDMALLTTIQAYSCHLNYSLMTETDIDRLRDAGYQIWCFTVNQRDDFPFMDRIDATFSDFPARFL